MGMVYLLFILCLAIIRFFAGYDSRFQKGKYITVRNNKLRILLTDETSFFQRRRRLKKDLNKMSLRGFVFYIISLVWLIFNIVLLCFVPKIPIEPWKIETENYIVYAETLNEKISIIVFTLLFLAVIGCLLLDMLKSVKTYQKWIKVLTYIVSLVSLSAVVFVFFDMIKELIMCFI